MSKIRINDLARELEVKSKTILDVLPEIGVTEKKTHSSSLEEHEAEKLRAHLRGGSEASVTSKRSEEHTSELQSHSDIVCSLLLEKKNTIIHELNPLFTINVT